MVKSEPDSSGYALNNNLIDQLGEAIRIMKRTKEIDQCLMWYKEILIKMSLDDMSPLAYKFSVGLVACKSPRKCLHPLVGKFLLQKTGWDLGLI